LDESEPRRRFPPARPADEAVRLGAADGEREPAEHLPVATAHAVHDVEVAQLQRIRRVDRDRHLGRLTHRSSTCWSPSATRLTPTIRLAIASPGKSTVHS